MKFLVPRKSTPIIGIIDTLNISPALALSLRKTRAEYTGPAIKVNRSADSNTLDIYFNGIGDLDTTALLAFAGNGSAGVITWYDQSGNNRNVSLSNGSAPQIVTNGALLTKNNKASINFANQYIATASTTVTSQSVNIVASSSTSAGNYPTFIRQKNDSGPEWAFRTDNSNSSVGSVYNFYNLPNSISGGSNNGSYLVVTAVDNCNSNSRIFGNSSQAAYTSPFTPSGPTTGIISIGANPSGGEMMNGYISELFVFETSLSDASRTILETSQLAYYINNTTSTANTSPTASTAPTAATATSSPTGPTSGSGSNATGATNVNTANPVFVSGAVTRFDLKASNSSVALNSPTNVDIIPNGNWSGQTINLSLTKGVGSYPATLTAPNSGNSIISFNYTPTSGIEHSITAVSNNIYSPLTHPINAYNSDNGTPSAISAISLVRSDQAPHQYNVLGKKPNGFENITCVGWSRVPFTITLTKSTNALYIKLIDALSFGANTNLNTGTYLNTTPIQVYGPLNAGTYTINLLLPAALYYYFAEFASDSAFTNPIRVANRFTCGLVVGINQRSMECAIARNYAYGTSRIDSTSRTTAYIKSKQLVVIQTSNNDDTFFVGMYITDATGNHAMITSSVSGGHGAGTYNLSLSMPDNGDSSNPAVLYIGPALNQTYDRGVTNVSYDTRYSANGLGWYRHDGFTVGNQYVDGSSAATMRFAELVGHYLGVTVGMTGNSNAGGGVDTHINHDGTPCAGFAQTIANVENEYRWAWLNNIGWDAVDGNYPTELFTEVTNRIITNCDYTMKNNPSVALIGLNYGCIGWNLNDGSRQAANGGTAGEYRMKAYLMNTIGSAHIFDKSSSGMANGLSPGQHPGQGHRTTYAEVSFRKFLYAEVAAFGGLQTKQTGPTLNNGTIARGSNQIKVGFTHHGGTTMNVWAVSFDPNDPTRNYRAPTGGELASAFTVYAGANSSSGGTAVMIDTVTVDNTNNQFILNLTPGQNLQDVMTLQFNCDFGISNYTIQPNKQPVAVFCADDNTDTSIGLNIGNQIISQLDIPITTI